MTDSAPTTGGAPTTDHAPATVRVARDARGPRATYEDFVIGADLGTIDWSVSQDDINRQCETDDDFHEWYAVESPYGGTIAPVLISYTPIRSMLSRAYNVRGMFYAIEMESIRPIRVGVPMRITGTIVDKWVKRDREYIAYEASCVDLNGNLIFRTRRTHLLDYIPRTAPRLGVAGDSVPTTV
jgi:hypothetical protein